MIELKQRVIFLDKMHLFNGLREEQLAGIAVSLSEREVPSENIIFKRGDKPDGFYMVYKGKVKVVDEFLAKSRFYGVSPKRRLFCDLFWWFVQAQKKF